MPVESSALGKMLGILATQYFPIDRHWHSNNEFNDKKPSPSIFSQSHREISRFIIKLLTQQDHDVHLWPIISTRSSLMLDWSQLTQVPIHSSLQNPREHRPRNPSTSNLYQLPRT
jgi:hypothetical protein